jgi:hypothetical protein
MTCQACRDKPCARWRAIGNMLGSWARERKRQLGSSLRSLSQDLPDPKAMDEKVGPKVDEAFAATCECSCHE